ncbi:MAG: DedA family protein [Actinomycetota bacterium]
MVEWIVGIVRMLGYPGIAFLMFVENVFPPLPSEGIMPFAGFLASRGELSLAGVILAGTAGSVLGTLPLYFVARAVGLERIREWCEKHGRWLTLSGEEIGRAAVWFDRYGGPTVLLGRALPGMRAFVSIPAGARRMPLGWFLVYNTLGSGLWTGFLTYLGVLLGQNYASVKDYLGPITWGVLALAGGALLLRVIKCRLKNAPQASERGVA